MPMPTYSSICVRPVVNCQGTYTIVSGSRMLPEVRRAMEEASLHYVHLDELMEGVSRRLAELTGAEWGIVTCGCAAALAHAAAASMAGGDPEKMQRLPDTAGMPNRIVMPRESRNVYDHALRMTGARIVTTASHEEFLAALDEGPSMAALLGETLAAHPATLEEICEAARGRCVPVLVDAAAERPTLPDRYLARGADLVAYSGGKCLRGPQSAGLLLGREDLVRAAWLNSAPHHAFGRPMKAGKEEIMGMLAALEAWAVRDHDAEWREWEAWLETIRAAVAEIAGVSATREMPPGPSNDAPRLRIAFDPVSLGATGQELAAALLEGEPRIVLHGDERSLLVMPYMMEPGEDRLVAEALARILRNPPRRPAEPLVEGSFGAGGRWEVDLEFVYGRALHRFEIEDRDGALSGRHRGTFLDGALTGERRGDLVRLRSSHPYEGTTIEYSFRGRLAGRLFSGEADLGEYGKARFTARRDGG